MPQGYRSAFEPANTNEFGIFRLGNVGVHFFKKSRIQEFWRAERQRNTGLDTWSQIPRLAISIMPMRPLLSSADAAELLGISTLTLYDWLSKSDVGELQIRGQQVTIDYFQGGKRGQGRIKIDEREVLRLLDLMRVHPRSQMPRKKLQPKQEHRHITTSLGRPEI